MSAETKTPPPVLHEAGRDTRTIREIGCDVEDRREAALAELNAAKGGLHTLSLLAKRAVELASQVDKQVAAESISMEVAGAQKLGINLMLTEAAGISRTLQDGKLQAAGGVNALQSVIKMLEVREGTHQPKPRTPPPQCPKLAEVGSNTMKGIDARREAKAKAKTQKAEVAKRESDRRGAMEEAAAAPDAKLDPNHKPRIEPRRRKRK